MLWDPRGSVHLDLLLWRRAHRVAVGRCQWRFPFTHRCWHPTLPVWVGVRVGVGGVGLCVSSPQVKSDAFSLGSADIATFIYREKVALALFLAEFGDRAGAAAMQASADDLHRAIDTHLWDPEERWVSTRLVVSAPPYSSSLSGALPARATTWAVCDIAPGAW